MEQHTGAIDLSFVMPLDAITREILAPDGTPTGWKMMLAGPSHPAAVEWSNEQARKRLRDEQQQRAAQANGRKVKIDNRDLEDVRRESVGWVISRILDWAPAIRLPMFPGEEFAFSKANAERVFLDPNMAFALNQIVDWLNDERSFTKSSATT